MEEKNLPVSPAKKRRHPWLLLWAVLAAIGLFWWNNRPVMPREFPTLGEYSGPLVASHQEAVVDAQLSGSTARYILDLLQKNQWKPAGPQPSQRFEGDLILRLGDTVLSLGQMEQSTYAQVTRGEQSGFYRLKKDVYSQITGLIYESFPGGVQTLDLRPWWEKYLAFAVEGLLDNDFTSPKAIPPSAVVEYTFRQMVADGSAAQFASIEKGVRVNNIPYDLFLQRARRYFTDGAGASIKQSSYYNAAANCFVFPAQENSWYGSYPYTDYNDWQQNNGYRLISVTRDQNGNIHATFEDYNRLGFQEQGTLTKHHYLTLARTSEGDYRFQSKHSELCNPSSVSAEGYFTGFGSLLGYTAEQAYSNSLGNGLDLEGDLLLSTVKYSKDSAQLLLYRLDTEYGNKAAEQVVSSPDGKTIFRQVSVVDNQVLIKTNREVILLDAQLSQIDRFSLPAEVMVDANGYDITNQFDRFAYTDESGVYLLNRLTGERQKLTDHPAATPNSQGELEVLRFRRPVFVQGGSKLLLSLVGEDMVKGYYLYDLSTTPPSWRRLALDPVGDGYKQIFDDKLVLTKYPDGNSQGSQVTEHTVQYFDEYPVRRFALDYDPDAPARYIQGNYLYCFQPEVNPALPEDRFYRLRRIDLRQIGQTELPVLIQNATPDILGVNGNGQVLFSYRSPAGSGFGLTHFAQ